MSTLVAMWLSAKDTCTLLELWARARNKMEAMQEIDCCSVPAEFETLIEFIGELRSVQVVQ